MMMSECVIKLKLKLCTKLYDNNNRHDTVTLGLSIGVDPFQTGNFMKNNLEQKIKCIDFQGMLNSTRKCHFLCLNNYISKII